MKLNRPTVFGLTLLLSVPAFAQPAPGRGRPAQTQPAAGPGDGAPARGEAGDAVSDRQSVTEHDITLGGQALHYRATAGSLVMKDDAGKARGDIFYVAYEKLPDAGAKGEGTTPATGPAANRIDPATRPITYVFNGGPGAASVWLHLGTVGPKRVKLTEEGAAPPPPFGLEDNPASWLDGTDLVFIDPVGTGYSRPAPGERQDQFSGVQEDLQWVGEFIRLWTTRNKRWASPKFLAGESYGTTRAAGLSDYLLDRHGIALNGIVFVSSVLSFQTISFGNANEMPFPLFMPSYTAIAAYHKKLPPELQADLSKTLKEVEAWTVDSYIPALARGYSLTPEQRKEIAGRLARYTGLPAKLIDEANLRIDPGLFRKALLEDDRLQLGRYDARLAGHNINPLARQADTDPSYDEFHAAYAAAFNQYVRQTLSYDSDRQYEVLSSRVRPWNYGPGGNGYLDTADNLQDAMRRSPHMKVLFASGLYDLATPYFATNYTVNHLELSPTLRKNVTQTFYPGGHMLYHHRPSSAQLHADVTAFLGQAAPQK